MTPTLGQILRSFFEDHLKVQKGLQPSSIQSYRDVLRLFLSFLAKEGRCSLTKLSIQDLTLERTLAFLKHLEQDRSNHIRTRNQRLAALRTFFEYVAYRIPEMLDICQRIAGIPVKRVPPPETHFLERQEVGTLLERLPRQGRLALRDRTLFMFLYNTGARVQEAADLRVAHLDLSQLRVQLHGKGNKWRSCPLWVNTASHLRMLLAERYPDANSPVFCSRPGVPLTRFGIYKIVRRYGKGLDSAGAHPRRVTPHLFRHTAAVHLLESGVEVNVIRGWLGHVSLDTTNRYAELTLRAKEAALRTCDPAFETSAALPRSSVWKDDESLLQWLDSL